MRPVGMRSGRHGDVYIARAFTQLVQVAATWGLIRRWAGRLVFGYAEKTEPEKMPVRCLQIGSIPVWFEAVQRQITGRYAHTVNEENTVPRL